MAGKRPACSIDETKEPPCKQLKLNECHATKDSEPTIDPVEQISAHGAAIYQIVSDLTVELDRKNARLLSACATVQQLRSQLAEHERIERDYGIEYKWEAKLKAQKDLHDEKTAKLKAAQQEKMDGKEKEFKTKLADLKRKQMECLEAKELRWKSALEQEKQKGRELIPAKETVWKSQISELKASHREQLDKVRANMKMVEAAQKVVALNNVSAFNAHGGSFGATVKKE